MRRKSMIDKKKVIIAVSALSIGMAGIIACSTFNEYLCQIKQAHENEFTERTSIWNLSKNMTAKEMLSRMTTVAKGDSVLVCKISRIPIGAYSDFMQETAKPTRRAWIRIREAHMESLINGIDWMEKRAREMPFSSYVLCSKSKYDEQGNSRQTFLDEKVGREKELDELYSQEVYSEEAFKNWEGRYKSLFSSTHYEGKTVISYNPSYFQEKTLLSHNPGIVIPF